MIQHTPSVIGIIAEPMHVSRVYAHQSELVAHLNGRFGMNEALDCSFDHIKWRVHCTRAKLEGSTLLFPHCIDNDEDLLGQIELGQVPRRVVTIRSGADVSADDAGNFFVVRNRLAWRNAIVIAFPWTPAGVTWLLLRMLRRSRLDRRGGLQFLRYYLDIVARFLIRHA